MFKYKKTDILQELKDKGYNTNRLRIGKFLNESAIQSIRKKEVVGIKSLDMLCTLLQCQLSDLVEHIPESEEELKRKEEEAIKEYEIKKAENQKKKEQDGGIK